MTAFEKPRLSRRTIVDAAIVLIDDLGLDRLTMRRLGDALGVEAMSLYNHVPNKEALLDGVMERIVTEAAESIGRADEWQQSVRGYADGLRAALMRHPKAAILGLSRPVTTEGSLLVIENALTVLERAGFSPSEGLDVMNSVSVFTLGHTIAEVQVDSPPPPALDDGRFPQLMRAVRSRTPADDDRTRFDYAIDALITGFASSLSDSHDT